MKVLIVEDEFGIIEMIKNTTPWASLGISEILTAGDGRTALHTVEREKPDIIISDIEMPVMDGVTMAETIMETMINPPEIIFLTCHAEFHYAQRAIRCGVTDYLLKPFFPEELTAVLSKVVVRCREKQSSDEMKTDTLEYILQGLLRDILNHVYDRDEDQLSWAARKRDVSLDLQKKKYMVAVGIPIEDALHKYTRSELLFMFGNIIRELLYGLDSGPEDQLVDYTVHNFYTGYLFLDEEHRTGAEEKCSRLVSALRQYLEVSATCVISGAVSVSEYAKTKDRIEAVLGRALGDAPGVQLLEHCGETAAKGKTRISPPTVMQFLRERKKSELLQYMRGFLEQPLSDREMKQAHRDILQVFYGYLYESRVDTTEFMQDEISRKVSDAAPFGALNMMKFVSYLYDSMVKYIEKLKKSRSVIERAKQFIAEHYMEDIGRTEIAAEVMLAPNYLSMLFHKETGQTIREYINLCRVEEAKKIMTVTDDSITDVAMQVGFDNISYFSTVFKKYSGISPAEFRLNLRENVEEKV